MFPLLWLSATLFGQSINTLPAQERTQGGQLQFDGKTLARTNEIDNLAALGASVDESSLRSHFS